MKNVLKKIMIGLVASFVLLSVFSSSESAVAGTSNPLCSQCINMPPMGCVYPVCGGRCKKDSDGAIQNMAVPPNQYNNQLVGATCYYMETKYRARDGHVIK